MRAQPFMTLDEYMEFEEQSPFRHEYVNGVVDVGFMEVDVGASALG